MPMRQDIRPIKAELRNRFKALRAGLSPAEKDEMDLKILNRVMNLWQYRDSQTILTYVSGRISGRLRRSCATVLKRCGQAFLRRKRMKWI
ncbi:MAG: hypothetical protein ACLUI8_11690 [Acutalibacteraceae bacterium]